MSQYHEEIKAWAPSNLSHGKGCWSCQDVEYQSKEFKGSWGWFQNSTTQKGSKAMLMFRGGSELDKTDTQLLESLYNKHELIRSIHLQVYTIWKSQVCFIGSYSIIPYSCQMKLYQLSEEKRNQKIGWLWLYEIIQMGPIRFCVVCLEKGIIPACSVGKCWPTPYFSQCKAWVDQNTYQKWLNTIFLPEGQKHTGSSVLLLLDNAPGHFNRLPKYGIWGEFFPQTAPVGSNHVTKE